MGRASPSTGRWEEIASGADDIDTLMVIGGDGAFVPDVSSEVARLLPALARRSRRITSVCAGALILAAAGPLDGFHATTHWGACDHLARRYPRVTVEPDRIYVHDRDRWTSAGVTAGSDLALALVEADLGAEIAQLIARNFVVFVRRAGGQEQYSAQLRSQPARTPSIRAMQQWLPDHLHEDLTIATLAERAGMSQRTFARSFSAETGSTPRAVHRDLAGGGGSPNVGDHRPHCRRHRACRRLQARQDTPPSHRPATVHHP